MKKNLIALFMVMALVFSLAACGKEPAHGESESFPETAAPAEEAVQNPVMSFVGVYSTENSAEALVEAEGTENAKITVTFAGNPWFHDMTVMSGRFDAETLTVEFDNAAMTECTYRSDGSVDTEALISSGGKGRAVFDPERKTLTITEESEFGDTETVYTWGPSADMKTVTDPDHYAMVTDMDKAEIETIVCYNVRSAYLFEDWYALSDMIRYPITINGTELADDDAFLGYMIDKTVAESDRQAMEEEDLLDMFVNGQGICMGDGEIWLSDPNYMTDREPVLEIIAINGIVSRDGGADQDGDVYDRDFYDGASVAVSDEDGYVYWLYEGSDGYWREEDGTTYVRLSDTEFQRRDGTKILRLIVAPHEDVEEFDRDFYDGDSVAVSDENSIVYWLYEGSDGYWREEDGTTYVRLSDTEFQRRDGTKILRLIVAPHEDVEEYDRDFYDGDSVAVSDEDSTVYWLYESSDGYWREEDGTAYIRLSYSEFQRTDDGRILQLIVAPHEDVGEFD